MRKVGLANFIYSCTQIIMSQRVSLGCWESIKKNKWVQFWFHIPMSILVPELISVWLRWIHFDYIISLSFIVVLVCLAMLPKWLFVRSQTSTCCMSPNVGTVQSLKLFFLQMPTHLSYQLCLLIQMCSLYI